MKTEFLEKWLQRNKLDLVKADLLWQVYVEKGDYMKAAGELYWIASSEGYGPLFHFLLLLIFRFPIDLQQRIEYFSRGIANAKSVGPVMSAQDAVLLHDLEEALDVMNVQMELYQVVKDMPEIDAAELNTRVLDISSVRP